MKIIVSNKLYIHDASPELIKLLKKSLTLANPAYTQMLRSIKYKPAMRRALYGLKKDFKYYNYDKTLNIFECGRGCLRTLVRYCVVKKIRFSYHIDKTNIQLSKPIKFNGTLRDYQVGVADTIIKNGDNGTIKLGTGFGKTLIACELIRKLNKTALIIVPRVSLLTQFKDTLKEFYNYEAGIIQGKTWNIKDITVASMATLKKRSSKEIQEKFSILLVDEAHTCISDKGISMVQHFKPKALFGLTATPRRTDGQGDAIFFTFGVILIDKALPQDKPTVQVIKSNVNIEVSHEYHEMIESMVESEERNRIIMMLARHELKKKRKILILTKRVVHYENICDHLRSMDCVFKKYITIHKISSKTSQKERDILLTKLRNNEEDFDIILGTFSLLSTGVDIPILDTLIFAGDIKSDVLAEQSIGRILRIFKGKNSPKIIDIDDNLNPILHRQFLERRKFYKSNKWEII